MFEIGTIVKPQGIRGELRVYPTTDDPSRFALLVGKDVLVRLGGKDISHKLLAARLHKNIVLVQLEGVNDRNMAESLVRGVVLIPDNLALPLDEGEYFVRDLVDMQVVDENGSLVGHVRDVMNTNANDVYIIDPIEGDAFMLPAIKKVVISVSVADKKMTVRMMDGLRELTV